MTTAFLFPGQGSQSVGMLAGLAAIDPGINETFAEAGRELGWDLAALISAGPDTELNRTEKTQPALLAASIAVWRLYVARGMPAPAKLAGHSLGEYSALVAAGAISFGDALRLVEVRGQLMQQAVPVGVGGMAAIIGLDDAGVEKMCAAYTGEGVLEPVNYNAPGQVVVAGNVVALDWLQTHGREHGAKKVLRLSMSVPSHCSLMRGAAEKLKQHLAGIEIRSPAIPVVQNVDAKARTAPDGIRDALTEQLYRPVLWTQTILAMVDDGIRNFVECGPGKVLTGLNKRIITIEGSMSIAAEDPASLTSFFATAESDS